MTDNKTTEALPTMPQPMPKVELDYPISPKENLKAVFDRKKPKWVPNTNQEKGLVLCPHDNDRPFFFDSGKDWFGVDWTFVPTAGGQMVTPNTFIMQSPSEWEEKLIFPDFDSMDFTAGKEDALAAADPNVMNFYLMQDGLFERLLSLATAEEVFCFLMEEEESATRFFERMADYKIALMDKVIREWAPFDAFINSDDWGTQISTFISPDMYQKYLYKPYQRIVDFAHKNGKYINFHSCGKVETLVPQMVKLGADMWEAQRMNDLIALRGKYGKELPIQIALDENITFREGVSDQAILDHVHWYIDTFAMDGGLIAAYMPVNEHVNELVARELYEYSKRHYA
ncbi:MAG: uroporphyrinogen decarboxylase family protein [Anaerofustis sp.]